MQRDVIHPEFPFTEDEVAAAWVVFGSSVEEARRMAQGLRAEWLASRAAEQKEGWVAVPGVGFAEGFDVVLKLVADIRAEHTLLSPIARGALLESWPLGLDQDQANRAIRHLEQLGPSWAGRRDELRRLLTGAGP